MNEKRKIAREKDYKRRGMFWLDLSKKESKTNLCKSRERIKEETEHYIKPCGEFEFE